MNSRSTKIAKLIDLKTAEIYNAWFADLREKWRTKSDQKLRALKKRRKEKKDLLSLLVKNLLDKSTIGKHDLDSLLHRVRTQEYSIFDLFLEVSSLEESIENVLRGSDEIRKAEVLDGMNLVHKKLSGVFGKILKQTSEIYEYIAESEGRGFCQVDNQRRVIFANEEMKRLLGLKSVTGKRIDSFFKGEEKSFVQEALSRKIAERPGLRMLELIADGGKSIPVGAEVAPLLIDGQIRGGYACMVDLSRPVKAQTEIFEQSPFGIAKVNLKEQITYLNYSGLKILGMDIREKKTLRDIFPDEKNYQKVREQHQSRKKGLSSEYEAEITCISDKKRVPVMISAMPETDLKGNVVGSIAMFRSRFKESAIEAIHKHIETNRNKQKLLTAVVKETEKIIPFQYFGAALYTGDMKHVRALFSYLPSGQLQIERRWWELSPQARKFLEGKKTIYGNLKDFLAQEKWRHLKDDRDFKKILDAGFDAFIYYPVSEEERLVGSITLYSRVKNAFDKNHVKLLEALPLDKALLTAIHYEKREDLEFRLNLIRKISSASNNIQKVADIIVNEVGEHYDWENVSLFRVDEERRLFSLVRQKASSKALRFPKKDYEQPLDEGILGYVYRNRVGVNIGDVKTDRKFKEIFKGIIKGVVSELCLPIIFAGKVCWIFNIEDSRQNAFSEEEKEALEGVLEEVGEFLQRSWLHYFLKATLESISDAVIVTDSKGIINQTNPAVTRLLGFSKAELMGSAFKDYFEDAEVAEGVLMAEKFPGYEVTLRRNNGDKANVLLSASKLPEQVGGKVFIAVDLSLQQRVEELEYLGKMYYEISAQTMTPLTLAFSWLNSLKSETETGHAPEILDKATRQLQKVQLSYDRLALYDREKEVIPYNELLLDIPEVLDNIMADFPKTDVKKIYIEKENSMPYLRGDLFQLSFCFKTILSYLLRFVREDEKVHLRIRHTPNYFRIEISGFFPGLPHEKFGDIAKKSLVSRALTQMALGEKIIRTFIANHKGRFHEPVREGEVMKFQIDLPTFKKGRKL